MRRAWKRAQTSIQGLTRGFLAAADAAQETSQAFAAFEEAFAAVGTGRQAEG